MQVSIALVFILLGTVSALEGPALLTENSVTAVGYRMTITDLSTVLRTENNLTGCVCRIKCMVDTACKGASYEMSTSVCVHTNATALEQRGISIIEEKEGNLFTFWPDDLISYNNSVMKMPDGLVYILVKDNVTFEKANDICNSLPGFKLAEFTHPTQLQTLMIIKKILGSFHIGVVNTLHSGPVFASGTPYGMSFMSSVFPPANTYALDSCYVVRETFLMKGNCEMKAKFACQAVFQEEASQSSSYGW